VCSAVLLEGSAKHAGKTHEKRDVHHATPNHHEFKKTQEKLMPQHHKSMDKHLGSSKHAKHIKNSLMMDLESNDEPIADEIKNVISQIDKAELDVTKFKESVMGLNDELVLMKKQMAHVLEHESKITTSTVTITPATSETETETKSETAEVDDAAKTEEVRSDELKTEEPATEAVKDDESKIEESKVQDEAVTEAASLEPKSEEAKVEEPKVEDDDETALLQMPFDMNAEDDNQQMMAAMRHNALLVQQKLQKPNDDKGVTFGARTDGSGETFDVSEEGDVVFPPPPVKEDELTKILDAPDAKGNVNKHANGTERDNDNVICVCKRQSAPRGLDRIRCKRHPTPTPTPIPTPEPIIPSGIVQCANGTWAAGDEKGKFDTICIYFPGQIPEPPPTPTPIPVPDREYPDECYDDRNEYVAAGVREKILGVSMLMQQGYRTCGCD
jgi:hypothetical protein